MPTYQYRCTECGDELEAVQKFTDEPLSVCPVCNGQLRKLFSAVGVVFKGSGFYKTDSRSSKSGSTPASKKDTAGSSDGSSGSSGDGSSDTSTPTKASDKDSSKSSTGTERAAASTGSGSSTGDGSKVA